eukprot:6197403-Pleurochrysis_carterae.AAC.2
MQRPSAVAARQRQTRGLLVSQQVRYTIAACMQSASQLREHLQQKRTMILLQLRESPLPR